MIDRVNIASDDGGGYLVLDSCFLAAVTSCELRWGHYDAVLHWWLLLRVARNLPHTDPTPIAKSFVVGLAML